MGSSKICGFLGLGFIIAALVLNIISLSTAWWAEESFLISGNNDCKVGVYWYWTIWHSPTSTCQNCGSIAGLLCTSSAQSIDGTNWRTFICGPLTSSSARCTTLPKDYDAAQGLMIASTVLAGILILLGVVGICKKDSLHSATGTITAVCGILCVLCSLAAVIVLAVGIPDAYNKDISNCDGNTTPGCKFIGSYTDPLLGLKTSWGPSTGWILAVISAGCAAAFSVLGFINR